MRPTFLAVVSSFVGSLLALAPALGETLYTVDVPAGGPYRLLSINFTPGAPTAPWTEVMRFPADFDGQTIVLGDVDFALKCDGTSLYLLNSRSNEGIDILTVDISNPELPRVTAM
ncbi:MAG TPA: hypothetical protein VE222_13565, partial [Nitrospiraceae bacterium]|nr:hypothetical protein [Nitrospiraceae bacterium]